MTMMPVVYKCSVQGCGKMHGVNDANSWLLMAVQEASSLCVRKWHDDAAAAIGVEHVCGMDHATILFAKWLSTGSLR